MKQFTHITSNIPCTISIDGIQTHTITQPNLKWLDLSSTKNFYITFLPQKSDLYLPTTTLSNNQITNNIVKIPYVQNHTEVIYTPSQILLNEVDMVLLEKRVGNIYIKITKNEKTHLSVISQATEILNRIIPNIISVNTEASTYFKVSATTEKNTQYVLLLNPANSTVLLEGEFNKIEEDSKLIKFLVFINDIAKHGIVYVFDKKTLKIDNYTIYKNNSPITTEVVELIPMAFLESIKSKDFNLAKYYLKENLVTNEHLNSYFGTINNIYYNSYYKGEGINYTLLSDTYKSYTFYVSNNKISDIEEVEFTSIT